jgi:hypothetical protein
MSDAASISVAEAARLLGCVERVVLRFMLRGRRMPDGRRVLLACGRDAAGALVTTAGDVRAFAAEAGLRVRG